MSQLFLISTHLRSWFQPKIGLQMLLPACVVPCVHLKRTHLFLFWYSPACKYPGECGLHSAPKCPLCEVHSTGYKLLCSYHGPELYSDRNIKLEKLYFGVLLFHTSFLFYCSVPFCCPVLSQALTWGIPSNYLLVSLLHSKLPVLFSSLLAFYVFLSPSIPFKHSTYVNFLY